MRKTITSPKGIAQHPHINEPDTKFGDGVYHLKIKLSAEDAEPFIEELEAILKEGYEAECAAKNKKSLKMAASKPWNKEVDDEDEETGCWIIKAKQKAEIETSNGPKDMRIHIVDAKRNPMTDVVGGGSLIKINVEPSIYFTPTLGLGVTLRLRAVQVLDLKTFSTDFGFENEDGFEVDSTESPEVAEVALDKVDF